MLTKPRFGKRRCSGIWPPSNPRMLREPERERCPLCPRVDVLPIPEPIPRPTRLRFSFALAGLRIVDRFIVLIPGHGANHADGPSVTAERLLLVKIGAFPVASGLFP